MPFDEQPDGDPHGECAAEIHRLQCQLDAIEAVLGGTAYMDPPDGGAPTLAERVLRMSQDARRFRLLCRAVTDEQVQEAIMDATPDDKEMPAEPLARVALFIATLDEVARELGL